MAAKKWRPSELSLVSKPSRNGISQQVQLKNLTQRELQPLTRPNATETRMASSFFSRFPPSLQSIIKKTKNILRHTCLATTNYQAKNNYSFLAFSA